MRITWCFSVVVLLGFVSAPSSMAQDFLKQLEERIFQKQQEAKAKESSQEEALPPEEDPEPIEQRDVLNPESLPSPTNANPNANNDRLELPSPTPAKRSETPKKPVAPRSSKPPMRTPSTIPDQTTPSPFPPKNPSNPNLVGGGGFLGLTVEAGGGGGFGLTVVEIAADSPAWKAGFRNGDRVIGVAGQAVSTVDAFAEQLAKFSPGAPVKFLVDRRGRNANLIAVLQDRVVAGQIQGARPGVAYDLNAPGPGMSTGKNGQAYFGINVSDMSDGFRRQFAIPAYRGASVTEVIPHSPAAAAGLKPGDCIVEMDGASIQTADAVMDTIQRSKPGQIISVSYYRGRQLSTASVPLIGENDGRNAMNQQPTITAEMLTPEYVSSLHIELDRVNEELFQTQSRLQQLEARLQSLENKR